MAAKYIVLVLSLNSFIGFALTTSKSTDPLLEHTVQSLQQTVQSQQQTVESLVQTVQSQQHNISDMRQNMATADVLRLYLTQEVRFRDELGLKMKELESNNTILQQHSVEQESEINNLRNNLSRVEELYIQSSSAQQHMEREIKELKANQSVLRHNYTVVNVIQQKQSLLEQEVNQHSISLKDVETKRRNDNANCRNSSEHLKQFIATVNRDLLSNISSLKTSQAQLTAKGNHKVCFTAYLSYQGPHSYQTVAYNRVMTNKGSAYNTTDGVFTAPRAGVYIFIWNSLTTSDNYCYLYLYKNGKSVNLAAFSDGTSAVKDSGSMSVVLDLTTGDRVWVRSAGCAYLYGDVHVSFTGCQI